MKIALARPYNYWTREYRKSSVGAAQNMLCISLTQNVHFPDARARIDSSPPQHLEGYFLACPAHAENSLGATHIYIRKRPRESLVGYYRGTRRVCVFFLTARLCVHNLARAQIESLMHLAAAGFLSSSSTVAEVILSIAVGRQYICKRVCDAGARIIIQSRSMPAAMDRQLSL